METILCLHDLFACPVHIFIVDGAVLFCVLAGKGRNAGGVHIRRGGFLHHLLLLRLKTGLPQMQLFPQQAVVGIEDEIDAVTGEVLLQILERFQIGAFLMGQACQHFHVLFIPDNEECEQPNQRLFMVDAKDAVPIGISYRVDQIALKLFFTAQHGV